MKPHVELIAAVGPNGELGLQGGLPWGRIKADMALFRRLTEGDNKLILCGRKTWQGLSPVAQRRMGPRTCVVSRQLDNDAVFGALCATAAYRADYVGDMREAWGRYTHMVIIGGAQVYREALDLDVVDVIHLSTIHNPDGWEHDVTFPRLHPRGWVVAESVEHEPEGGAPYGWRYTRLVRDPAHWSLED